MHIGGNLVQFTYKKHGFQIEQQWFTGGEIAERRAHSQIVIAHAVNADSVDKKFLKRQNSLMTDLTGSEEDIFAGFNKNTKYEIRRADREGAQYRAYWGTEITDELINAFGNMFCQMYTGKNIKKSYNYDAVRACVSMECIVFTIAYINKEPLVFHSYIYDEDNVRLYHSCSLFRDYKQESKIIGFMNRGLHWHDIRLFKEMGRKRYDWGGIVSTENPNGIDIFKMGFGGVPISYFNATIPITAIAKGIVLAREFV